MSDTSEQRNPHCKWGSPNETWAGFSLAYKKVAFAAPSFILSQKKFIFAKTESD